MQTFVCEICRKIYPEEFLDVHHKIPKALGGPDTPDNLAKLCGADHKNLHAIAYVMNNKKKAHTTEMLAIAIFPQDLNARKRLIEFAGLVAREMALRKELPKINKADEARTIVELPILYMELMRLNGYDNLSEKGKPKGVARQIRELVAIHLSRKFPLKRDQILALVKKS